MHTVGLDATRGGWLVVALHPGAVEVARLPSAREALARWPEAAAYGIDIPIGLLDAPREADAAARRALPGRGATVFSAPCAAALAQPTYAEAHRVQREVLGVGLTKQAYLLKERIEDAAAVASDPRVHEVHPELVFARLAGAPLAPKKSWNGQHARRQLLAAAGVILPEALGEAGGAPPDDVLDAAVAALGARHVVTGEARTFPEAPHQRDPSGRLVVIRG